MRGLMRPIGVAAAALVAVTPGALGGESLDGFWMDSHGEVILDIGKCGNARCGKVAWLQKPRGPDRGPLRDFRNSDPKLQSRFVCGLPVVTGFKKQAGRHVGRRHRLRARSRHELQRLRRGAGAEPRQGERLRLLPIFGSSEVWTRIKRKPPSCEEQAKMIAEDRWTIDMSGWEPVGGAAQKPAAASGAAAPKPAAPMAAR